MPYLLKGMAFFAFGKELILLQGPIGDREDVDNCCILLGKINGKGILFWEEIDYNLYL